MKENMKHDDFLKEMEEKMGIKIITIEPGIAVLCDLCGEDYTNSDDKSGYIFANKAVCPKCADRFMESIKHHNEEQYITLRANKDESFRDFVYRVRSYE